MQTRKLPNSNELESTAKEAFGGVKSTLQSLKAKGGILTQSTLNTVKQRPAAFLGIAAATGFILGRVIRRKF